MGKLSLLDCTLSSGICFSDRCFEEDAVTEIPRQLQCAGVEVIMLGTLKDEPTETGKALFRSMEDVNALIAEKSARVKYAVSIDMADPLPVNKILPASPKGVTIVQVCIPTDKLGEGVLCCKALAEKGYELFVRPLCVSRYSEEAFVEIVERFNSLTPSAFYISDDWGICNTPELLTYIRMAAEHLRSEIALGYHGHNNIMQAFDSAKALCEFGTERDVYIDASIDGIGRDAGNLDTHIIAQYLNQNHSKKYKISGFSELSSKYIQCVRASFRWGFSPSYYLAAIHNCDPNYSSFYEYEAHLPAEDIEGIIKTISAEDRFTYHEKKAKKYLYEFRRKKIKLLVIVPVKGKADIVRYWLSNAGDEFYRYGVDLLFFDGSETDEVKNLVHAACCENIFWEKYEDIPGDKTLDEKAYQALKLGTQRPEYDFLWLIRDRSIPNFPSIYSEILKAKKEKLDFIIAYPHYVDPSNYGTKEFDDAADLLRELCGEMTSLGSIIFSNKIAKNVVDDYPVDAEKNYGLWLPIALFQYLANKPFHSKVICNNNIRFVPYINSSFWIKSNTLYWLFSERWVKMVESLPSCYDRVKKDVLQFKGWHLPPFSKQFILTGRACGGNSLKDFFTYRKYFKKIGAKRGKLFFIGLLPAKAVKFYLEKPNSILLKPVYFVWRKLVKPVGRFIKKIGVSIKSMLTPTQREPYDGFDFGSRPNSFEKDKHIKSNLLVGDINAVKNPFLTVAIPTYKRTTLLESALRSAVEQSAVPFEWEIIVVDNEPDDKEKNAAQQIVEKYDDKRILYFRNEQNLGITGNFNRCIELARGEWVSFLHDDDLLMQDYLKKIVRRIYSAEKASPKKLAYIAASPIHIFHHQSGACTVSKTDFENMEYTYSYNNDIDTMQIISPYDLIITGGLSATAPTTGTLLNRSIFIQSGGFNENGTLVEDNAIVYALLNKYLACSTQAPLGYYRWFSNESIGKFKDIERGFYQLREYAYRKNLFSRVIGHCFRQEHFQCETNSQKTVLSYAGQHVDEHFYDDIMIVKANPVRSFTFRVVNYFYQKHRVKRVIKLIPKEP